MKEIQKVQNSAVLPKYRLVEWIFEDQFWNKVKWVICSCWKPWLESKFKYYTNYWWTVRKLYACDDCLKEWGQDNRVNRDKRIVRDLSYRSRDLKPTNKMVGLDEILKQLTK